MEEAKKVEEVKKVEMNLRQKLAWGSLYTLGGMALLLAGMGTAAVVKDIAEYIKRPDESLVKLQPTDFNGDGKPEVVFYRLEGKTLEYKLQE